MTDTGTTPQKDRLETTWRIVLFASLALNMFLLGAGTVTLMRFAGHPGPHFFKFQMQREFPGPGMILRALPQGERERVEKEIGPRREAMQGSLAAARKARREALAAFSEPSYAAETMKEKLKAMREADLAAVGAVHEVLGELVDDLSPEDRTLIIEALKNRRMGPPGMPGGFGMGGSPPPSPDGPPPSDGAQPPDGPPPAP